MKNKKRFVTLFPLCTNRELIKDVGQIPEGLSQYLDFDFELWGNYITSFGGNIEAVSNVKIVSGNHKNDVLPMIIHLIKNANSIDWLNVYHSGKKTLLFLMFYKIFNKAGKVYLKLDADYGYCRAFENSIIKRVVFYLCTKFSDLVSVESNAVKERIQKYAQKDIFVLMDGYCEYRQVGSSCKKNVFLTVGRLGTYQKATEILLESFAISASKHDWQLRLVGSIESSFQDYIKKYYERNPDLKSRVLFMGEINDRGVLYDEYDQAKVFVLPSRSESFGIVLAEALSCGCYIISTDSVPPIDELTCYGKYGRVVHSDDIVGLADCIIDATRLQINSEMQCEMKNYASKNFTYRVICKKLSDKIKEIDGSNL